MSEDFIKECKEIKHDLKLVKINSPTQVISLATHKDYRRNDVSRLPCKHLMPMEGFPLEAKIVPVGGYTYDNSKDCYLVNCIDLFPVGILPFSYKLRMSSVVNWSTYVPIPYHIVRRHISDEALAAFDKFEASYKSPDFELQLIQFIVSC